MALNKFMHPRNVYKNRKPDFQVLALKYPEFRKFVFADITGKLFLDFKHPESLRELTVTMMKEDFDIDLELPLDRLIPTIPLRLNYVHWIEDILSGSHTGQSVRGIDIGTGSSCIFPLLCCKLNKKWEFCASEIDDQNYDFAIKNIDKNGYSDRIKVKKVPKETILHGIVSDMAESYEFCMCNPPFFADHLEAQAVIKSQLYSRSTPSTVCTADEKESIVEGGEVNFVKKIIQDSLKLRAKVRIYTSMVGKKASLGPLKEELKNLKVVKFATTEFCQGKTMRWGIAWTFDHSVNFPKSFFKANKKEKPVLSYSIPDGVPDSLSHNVKGVTDRLKQLLEQLEIEFEVIKKEGSMSVISANASENTWSHQRRKRRERKRQQGKIAVGSENFKDTKVVTAAKDSSRDIESREITQNSKETPMRVDPGESTLDQDKGTKVISENKLTETVESTCDIEINAAGKIFECQSYDTLCMLSTEPAEQNVELQKTVCGVINSSGETAMASENDRKRKNTFDSECSLSPPKRHKSDNQDSEEPETPCKQNHGVLLSNEEKSLSSETPSSLEEVAMDTRADEIRELFQSETEEQYLFKSTIKVKKTPNDLLLEMTWIDGTNRESMHQVMQFFKNKMHNQSS